MTVALVLVSIVALAALCGFLFCNGKYRKELLNVDNLQKTILEMEKASGVQSRAAEISAEKIKSLEIDLANKNSELKQVSQVLSDLRVENGRLLERQEIIEKEKIKMEQEAENRFKLLANEIFSSQSEKFRQNNEARLDEILKPLKENINDFKKTIVENYTTEAKERHTLSCHIKDLMNLNASIGKDARDLTEALKGNTKVQGDWGEMILDSILEKSGLIKGENYFIQETRNENGDLLTDENGRQLRPDVVVCLPDKKFVVIDSKVSLTAYTNYVNADNEADKERYGKQHVASVRSHIKELEAKKYQDYVGVSPDNRIDYVLMFIPNEHAYLVAMSLDKQLWQEAYDKRIVIISPAHVISTLRLIAQLWTRDKQTKNALRIAEESGKLYDKFVGFVDDMKGIEVGINKTQTAYANAFKKLTSGNGNLISKVENLRTLGARASKMLPSQSEE